MNIGVKPWMNKADIFLVYIPTLIFIGLTLLKIFGLLDWHWILIFLPMVIPLIWFIVTLVFVVFFLRLQDKVREASKSKKGK